MIRIADLLEKKLIEVGQEIVFSRPSLKIKHRAKIQADGSILTEDGTLHKSPSGAARHFSKKPIDGWIAWKIGSTAVTLADVRAQITD